MKKILTLSTSLTMAMTVSCSSNDNSNIDKANKTNSANGSIVVESAEAKEEIVITMASHGYNPYISDGINMIDVFNSIDNGYRIELKDYSDYYESSKEHTKEAWADCDLQLSLDVMKGGVIDIIPNNFYDSGKFHSLAAKGAFADLNTFLEADEKINRDVLFDNVLETCEIDEKLFYMPICFTIDTIFGPTKYVGNKENWSMEELKQHWDKMPENALINGHNTRDYVYYAILRENISNFIDYGSATCSFNSPEFISILNFINTFDEPLTYKSDSNWNNPIFLEETSIYNFNSYSATIYNDRNYEITFVGYPSSDKCGSLINTGSDQIAISASSSKEKQKGAWEFVRMLVDYEFQYNNSFSGGFEGEDCAFPINIEAFEEKGKDIYHNDDGNQIEYSEEDEELIYYPINKADYDRLLIFIKSIKKQNTDTEDDIFEIINNELFEMFRNEKTSQQAAENIQNRVSILVSERN